MFLIMSMPGAQNPGGMDLPESFGACLSLTRAQRKLVGNLEFETIGKAHDFVASRLGCSVQLPGLIHCQPQLFMEGVPGIENGGLQFYATRIHDGRLQTVGARVMAYYSGESSVRETDLFYLHEAESIARSVETLAALCMKFEAQISPDLTYVLRTGGVPVLYC